MNPARNFPHKDKREEMIFWDQPIEALFARLESQPGGLTAEQATQRLAVVGPNSLEQRKQSTPLGLFLNQFKSPIVLILLAATIISAFVHDWTDAIIILAIVMGSAVLSFIQEYSASNAADKLRQQVSLKAKVVRDGMEMTHPG